MFRKCESLLQNIVYMAIMAAINIVFVLISTLLPYALFILVFILPLTSTLVTLFCNKRYYIIYFFATVSLCMFATIWNISDTILYVIPSLISGFVFGVTLERKIPAIYAIIAVSILQFGFHYLGIVLVKTLFNIDIVDVFAKLFNLTTFTYLSYIVPAFLYFLSLTQSSLTYIVIKGQLPKLQLRYSGFKIPYYIETICILINSLFMLLFSFIVKPLSFVFLFNNIFISIHYFGLHIFDKNKIFILFDIASILLGFIPFIVAYNLIETPLQFLFFALPCILQSIIVFINNSLSNKKVKVK